MPAKILIVEDNEKNRALLGAVLEHFGYEVLEAADGVAGVAAARDRRPELIILDIQMPVMGGMAAAAILKGDPETKGIKLIALTSFAMKGDRERFLEAGFDDYVAKPIDTRRLPELIRRHLGRPEGKQPGSATP